MARINIDNEFWENVSLITGKLGCRFLASGQALQFLMMAQSRYKSGGVITEEQWKIHGFHESLIGIFAERVPGGFQAIGAEKQFGWLRKCVEAGREGGKKSGESRRNEINHLTEGFRRVLEGSEPSPSSSPSFSSSSSSSSSEGSTGKSDPNPESGSVDSTGQLELSPPPDEAIPEVHPLARIWNEHRGGLPRCRSCTGPREKKARARWKEQRPDEWAETVKRMAASPFCNGKNDRGWKADFDFFLKPDTWQKVNDGKYDGGALGARTRATAIYDNLDTLEQKWREQGRGDESGSENADRHGEVLPIRPR